MQFARLYHTLKYLRREQIVGQVARRLRPRPRPRDGADAPPLRYRGPARAQVLPPAGGAAELIGPSTARYTFVGQTHDGAFPPRLETAGPSKLWEYNLHYFEWAWRLSPDDAERAAFAWVGQCRGGTGWAPYPTSLRLMNWAALFHHVRRDRPAAAQLWPGVWQQACFLEGDLETHLLGNHLLENVAALAYVGGTFAGRDADRWLAVGLRWLRRELAEQILPDGTHFELSPMYHARAVYVLCLLASLRLPAVDAVVVEPLRRACAAMGAMTHPDGDVALLNDSTLGIYPRPGELLGWAAGLIKGVSADLPVGPFALPDAGYYGHRSPRGDYVICDAGPIGPDYLPGHAHCDLLSFELSLGGRRVVTDTGVFDYGRSPTRHLCRSTAAHNTVQIGGAEQSEIWAAFRVGRRARPVHVSFEPTTAGFGLSAGHDGYRRLRPPAHHARRFGWTAAPDGARLTITDTVRSTRPWTSRLHLHPRFTARQIAARTILAEDGSDAVRLLAVGGNLTPPTTAPYYERFGCSQDRPVVAIEATGAGQVRWDIGACSFVPAQDRAV
jgi:uncharacterized heparinase superfamily protein